MTLDSAGDLQVDSGALEDIARRWVLATTVEAALGLSERIDAIVARLESLTTSTTAPLASTESRLLTIGDALSEFMPLPILAKMFIGAMLAWLRRHGFDGPLPLPSPSPGARLAADLATLAERCAATGISPAELRDRWPGVPPEVAAMVRQFAADHCGFGPLAWEAPGFDEPSFVLEAMVLSAGHLRGPEPRQEPIATVFNSSLAAAVYLALGSWIDVAERGILMVRRSFHISILPLLAPTASVSGVTPIDILFARFDEIADGLPSPSVLRMRRQRYETSTSYLDRNGIKPERLDHLVAA